MTSQEDFSILLESSALPKVTFQFPFFSVFYLAHFFVKQFVNILVILFLGLSLMRTKALSAMLAMGTEEVVL